MFGTDATYEVIHSSAMFAGKSSELIRRVRRLRCAGRRVLLATSARDDRHGPDTPVTTHDQGSMHAFRARSFADIVTEAKAEASDVVAIDEAQMFASGFKEGVAMLLSADISVIAAGLDTTWDLKQFGEWVDTHRLADKRTHLVAVCARCPRDGHAPPKDAAFTDRIQIGTPSAKSDGIVVGGAETYVPVCRKCWGNREG